MTRIAVVCPGYPDVPGGVNDHTHRIIGSWSAGHDPVLALGNQESPATAVAEWVSRGVSAVLIQYVPFLYARFGLSRFPAAIARAARARGLRITLFVHEPWVPPTRLPWLVLSPLQRRQLLRLTQLVDAVVTAVPAWRSLLGGPVHLVYVGSSLGDPPADAPRLTSPLVFSPFASGLSWPWIAAAVRAIGADPPLVLVGGDAATGRTHPATAAAFDPAWDWRGRLPAAEALAVIAGAPLVLAPFADGATGRRSSLLASLSTGVPVISSSGHLYDPMFGEGPVNIAATAEEFVRLAQEQWQRPDDPANKRDRLDWYTRTLDPGRLDADLLRIVTGAGA